MELVMIRLIFAFILSCVGYCVGFVVFLLGLLIIFECGGYLLFHPDEQSDTTKGAWMGLGCGVVGCVMGVGVFVSGVVLAVSKSKSKVAAIPIAREAIEERPCPKCSKKFPICDEMRGKSFKCPHCGQVLKLPAKPA